MHYYYSTVLLTFAGDDNADNAATIPNKKRQKSSHASIENNDALSGLREAKSAIAESITKPSPTRYSARLATLASKRYAASGPGPIDDELKTPPPLQTTKAKDPITGSTDEATPSQSKAKIQAEPKDITAETVTRKSPPKYKESGPSMPQTVTRKAPPKYKESGTSMPPVFASQYQRDDIMPGVFRYSITFQLARGDKLGVHFRIGAKYKYLVVNGVDFDGLAAVTDGVYGMCMEEESELI